MTILVINAKHLAFSVLASAEECAEVVNKIPSSKVFMNMIDETLKTNKTAITLVEHSKFVKKNLSKNRTGNYRSIVISIIENQ